MSHSPLHLSRRVFCAASGSFFLAGCAATPQRAAPTAAVLPLRRAVPKSGELLPVIGLGTNNYSPQDPQEWAARRAVLARMPTLGLSVIDTAPAYRQSETTLGTILGELKTRQQFFVATKLTAPGGDRAAAAAMFEQSFERLGTARLDLVQVHNLDDLEPAMAVLSAAKQAGRIRYVGVTTSRAAQYPQLLAAMREHPLDFLQVDYSIGNRAAAEEVLPLAVERKIAVLINLPFGGRRDGNILKRVAGRPLPQWAAEFDVVSWAQFCLKYVIAHPAVTCVIPGTTQVANLEDNAQAAFGRQASAEQRARMAAFWDTEFAG
jgi:aryl-alcohol dehydrogenase-like predicted oxidoreductase